MNRGILFVNLALFVFALLLCGCGGDDKLRSISMGTLSLRDPDFRGIKVEDSDTHTKVIVLYETGGSKAEMLPYQEPPVFNYGDSSYEVEWGNVAIFASGKDPVFLKLGDREIEDLLRNEDLRNLK